MARQKNRDRVPKSFTSPGKRRFTVETRAHREERYEGDPLWSERRDISRGGKVVGILWKSETYGPDLLWRDSTKAIRLTGGEYPPKGIGFDGGPHATAAEALAEFGRIADEVLDWRAGKRVRSIYSKTGYYQKEKFPNRRAPRRRA